MDYNKLLEGFWRLPALIAGCEAQLAKVPVNPYVQAIWTREGWTLDEACVILGLVKHELKMAEAQAHNQPIRISAVDYGLLRSAFSHYTKSTMAIPTQLIASLLPNSDENSQILDYGGGEGRYLQMVMDAIPDYDLSGFVVDKAPPAFPLRHIFYIQRDFKVDTHWYKDGQLNFLECFDFILLNEVLHCQELAHFKYLLNSSYNMLKPGGWLVIGERDPTPEFQWRMSLATQGGHALENQYLYAWLCQHSKMDWSHMCDTTTHYFIQGQKT